MPLDDRQTATVLAALRYWQREGWRSGGREHEIATNAGEFEAMDSEEIDKLCISINCGIRSR